MSLLGTLASAALGGLASGLGAVSAERAKAKAQRKQWEREVAEKRRQEALAEQLKEAARKQLADYGYTKYGETYTPYTSSLESSARTTLANYLSGELTPAQEAMLERERTLGTESIMRTAANRGIPTGGRMALGTQLAEKIALGKLQATEEAKQRALSQIPTYEAFASGEKEKAYRYGLEDYLREQEAKRRKAELMAQYTV